jgi:prolycopene isomerase
VIASAVQPALENLLDKPELLTDRYRRKITQMHATGSYYIAYYSVCADAVQGLWPNTEIHTDCSTTRISEKWSSDVYYILIPSLVDTTAAPPGCHCLCLSVPCLPGCALGAEGRRECRKFLEQAVAERFPTLKGKMTFLFELAPEHLASISGNPGGSAYGWEKIPEQSGVKRLNIKTPIPGLYLAGHWTMPGGGIAGVVTSGRLCAQAIIEDRL